MQSEFRVDTHTTGRVITLTLTGELDLVSGPAFEAALERANDSDADVTVVDLRTLEFMDSTGLHVLVKGHQRAQESGRAFAVTRGSEQVERLLTLTGIADIMTVVDSPEELLETGRAPDSP